MIELQKYIKRYGVKSLQDTYAVKVTTHSIYPNLHLFKYNQLNSPMDEVIVQQSRGIILDADDDWRIVNYPYSKFFNQSENLAATIDWNTARVQEKLDGSVISLWHYDDKWHMSTSGSPDGLVTTPFGNSLTFKELFWETFNKLDYKLPTSKHDKECCYMFELMTPYNLVVVQHKSSNLVLHGCRCVLLSLLERRIDLHENRFLHEFNWRSVYTYKRFDAIEYVVEAAKQLNGTEQEGFVVVDDKFNRVKIKSPDYLIKHSLKSGLTSRSLINGIIQEQVMDVDELKTFFPEYKDIIELYESKVRDFCHDVADAYLKHCDIESQKDFALAIKNYPFKGLLFSLRNNKIADVQQGLRETHIHTLEKWFNIDFTELGI